MKVRRIVSNITVSDPKLAKSFTKKIGGLFILFDHCFIATYGSGEQINAQISFAAEGGSGTPVPELSIEVDDLNFVLEKVKKGGFEIEYGPVHEPWGVYRFFVRDPFGKLVNILVHE
jgi:catechol 2,3-dioxygenase-like lactoylglutathione lyase family enzyme